MQETLEDFFKALRGSDLDVSLTDGIEAGRALSIVGVADREVLRHALGATLAKSLDDRIVFDACFDRFFSYDIFKKSSGAIDQKAKELNPSESQDMRHDEESAPKVGKGQCAGAGGGGGAQGLADMLLRNDQAALVKSMNEAARQVGVTDIWFFTQKGQYIQKIQEQMGLKDLNQLINGLASNLQAAGRVTNLKLARRRLFEEVRNFVEKQLAMYGKAPTKRLHDEYLQSQKLSNIEQRDFQRMHEIVRKLAKRLAVIHSKKKKQETRGQLDFRKTMRRNVAFDGVLFETYWRTKVIERAKVIAICDVSGSVRNYARFLLLFLYSLTEFMAKIRSFAFTNTLVEVTDVFDDMPVNQAVDKVMKEVGGSGTDYGQMFRDVEDRLMSKIDKRTTVLILGDARNNHGEPQADVMRLLHQRAKRVIWLNPEPRAFWGLGDSEMKRYAPHCHIVKECNTLKHLERTMDDLLRVSTATV